MASRPRPKGKYGGRPFGYRDALPKGGVKAIASLRIRVPDNVSEEAKELADTALQRIADVMLEKVSYKRANSVLKSATAIREEICGPVTRKVEVEGKIGITALLDEMNKIEIAEAPRPKALPPVIRKAAQPSAVAEIESVLISEALPQEEEEEPE